MLVVSYRYLTGKLPVTYRPLPARMGHRALVLKGVGQSLGTMTVITFCVSRRRRKMYCGHARLCVCLSVRGHTPTLLHGPGCNLGMV